MGIDSIYMNVNGIGQDGSNGALLMNLLIPLDGNSQAPPQPITNQPMTPITVTPANPETPSNPVVETNPQQSQPSNPTPNTSGVEDEWPSKRCGRIVSKGKCSKGNNAKKCAKSCGGTGGGSS